MKFRKRIQQLAAISDRLPLPASSPRSIMTPTDVAAAFAKAWSKRDADAIADLFVEDADFVNVVGLWWRSKRSIRRAHAYGFEHAFGKATLKIDKVTERRLGDDVAVVHAQWRMTGQVDPQGRESGSRRGVLSAVLTRLADGSWIGVSCQNTDTAHAADTNISVEGHLGPVSYIATPSKDVLAAIDRESRQQAETLQLG